MKKIALLSALTLGLGFTACDSIDEPNAPAQSNPQEAVVSVEDVEVSDALNAENVYDLAALNTSGTPVQVASIFCENLPEGYDFSANVEISVDGFSKAYAVPSTTEAATDSVLGTVYNVFVTADDLQGVYYNDITKDPNAAQVEFRFTVQAQNGTEVGVVGGPTNYYGPYQATIKPFASDYEIENAYYLVVDGDIENAVEFNHSSKSPYDDPVFTLIYNVPEGGITWQVLPESAYAASTLNGAYAPAAAGENGTLELNADAAQFSETGPYMFTIDMKEYTYEISQAVECIYTPGNSNGWSQAASQILTTTDYENYYGYVYLDGEFKFDTTTNWSNDLGMGSEEGTLAHPGANINPGATGVYWVHLNLPNLTYELTLIETIGIIGGFEDNSWGSDVASLEPTDNPLVWEGECDFTEGVEWKFRANEGWDVNLGGSLEDLVQNGANIVADEAGKFTVTLNLSQVPYSAQLVKAE